MPAILPYARLGAKSSSCAGSVTSALIRRMAWCGLGLTLLIVASAQAAPYSGLRHRCSYKFGTGAYQSVSYSGQTSCAEARALIIDLTADGEKRPTVGVRTGRTPHGTWRCRTVRRAEVHGVIVSTHRITCRLIKPKRFLARIRFFYES